MSVTPPSILNTYSSFSKKKEKAKVQTSLVRKVGLLLGETIGNQSLLSNPGVHPFCAVPLALGPETGLRRPCWVITDRLVREIQTIARPERVLKTLPRLENARKNGTLLQGKLLKFWRNACEPRWKETRITELFVHKKQFHDWSKTRSLTWILYP